MKSDSRKYSICLLLCGLAVLLTANDTKAATVPAGFTDAVVAAGLNNPTAMALAPDGRIFVCQQGGALRVIKNGVLLATPFLTVTVDSSGERGLLGVALDPNFVSNQLIYVYYTATNHNGGAMHFGPDGNLYVAVGENANAANAQSLSTRLGKMLRMTSTGGV